MKLAADIIAVMSRTRFHRILWQELNRKFGDGISTVFVMTPGQTLLHSEYDVSNLSDWASYKTFELVDNALQCATNYSETGWKISMKWEQLLTQGKGPNAGPQHQAAFDKAKKVLFDVYNTKHSEFYEEYLQKQKAFRKKKYRCNSSFKKNTKMIGKLDLTKNLVLLMNIWIFKEFMKQLLLT